MEVHHKPQTGTIEPGISSTLSFESEWYQIKQLDFQLQSAKAAVSGFNDSLCMVFVQKGWFPLNYPDHSYQMAPGYILLDKPGYEYEIMPSAGICTVINYSDRFYRELLDDIGTHRSPFFSRENLLSIAMRTTPAIDFLHFELNRHLPDAGQLQTDYLVFELFRLVIKGFDQTGTSLFNETADGYRRATVELAKHYMYQHLNEDLSLAEIAKSCHISPFHFCRVFKLVTGISPNRYLQQIRLKNSELLLKQPSISIAEAAYLSGFNSLAYFDTVFKQQYGFTPTVYRSKLN